MGRRSDPGWRDRAALDLLTRRVLPTLPAAHHGPILLANEWSRAVAIGDREVRRWDLVADRLGPGRMLPDPPAVAVAAVRMPRSRAALAFATRAAASTLRPGGLLLVYGANDEGTGAVERELGEVGASAQTWAVGGRCRVVGGVIDAPPEPPDVEASAIHTTLELPHAGERDWISFPGAFAAGRLDAGTRLLLGTLEPIAEDAHVLDYGAGTGIIGAVALQLGAGHVTLLEPDALAAEAARRNVPGARVVEAAGWDGLRDALGAAVGDAPDAAPDDAPDAAPRAAPRDARFDLVLANPPYHRGKAETVQPVLDFIRGAPDHLAEGGRLRFVVQRRMPVERALREGFSHVEVIVDDGPYRVWEAR